MATIQAVRGTSVTQLEDAPSPPTQIFDVKVNIASEAIEHPISLPPIQRNGSLAIKTRKSIVSSIFERSEDRMVWPEPEKSIGTGCCQVGESKLQCWEARGPALELTQNLVSDVRTHLNCKTDYIYGHKSVRPPLVLGVYMVGKSIADARPFLVVSCLQDEPRERAMRLIKKSKILDQFKENGGVRLREQRRPPISIGPVTLASGISTQDMSNQDAVRVFYDPQQASLGSSIQLYTQFSNDHGLLCQHKATLGCFLWFRGRYLAFTAAHPFLDLPPISISDEESELDFPFEDESEISSFVSDEDESESMRKASNPSTPSKGKQQEGAANAAGPEIFDEPWDSSLELQEFGFLFASSIGRGDEASLDWALIEITQPRLDSDTITNIIGSTKFVVLHDKPIETKVFAKMVSNGIRHGDLSPMPTFMLLPGSPKFQEIWTVRFDSPLERGDCGTLVVDAGGNIYGHLVAGDLENKIGYIIPATQTFENMKQHIGNDLSTIRPPLKTLNGPLSPKPRERMENVPSISGSPIGPLNPSLLPVKKRRISNESVQVLPHLLVTVEPPALPGATVASILTASQSTSAVKDTQTVRPDPTLWDAIQHSVPSISWKSHSGAGKYSEKTPGHESQASSRRGPSRGELAMRARTIYSLRQLERWTNDWRNPLQAIGYEPPRVSTSDAHTRRQVLEVMDSEPYYWQIVRAASSGVFSASYAFLVPYMILPALNFVYWPSSTSLARNYEVHLVTLTGAIFGSFIAGTMSDIFGRKQLYRLGPLTLLIGAIGLAGASAGFNNSTMSMLGWIIFWQFFTGAGIGVEWTLSGVISAEFAPARHRSRMMATILSMQPIAYLVVSALVLVLLVTLGRGSGLRDEADQERAAIVVDKLWRYLVGFGGIPALITLFFRTGMPESPRFSFDLADEEPIDRTSSYLTDNKIRWGSYFIGRRFLQSLGNWRHLIGLSICAFILNAAIGSLGADNYRVLAQIWNFSSSLTNTTSLPIWNDGEHEATSAGEAIYDVLFDMSLHSIYTLSIASVIGSLLFIKLVVWHPANLARDRRRMLVLPSLVLAVVFVILASISLASSPSSARKGAMIAMTILCYFIFNIGPNFLLFVVPLEIFPTSYRATCFALVYSSGKIGSILVQAIPAILYSRNQHGRIYFLFSMVPCFMATSLLAWAWLPPISRLSLEKNVETLLDPGSDNREAPGLRRRFKWWRSRRHLRE